MRFSSIVVAAGLAAAAGVHAVPKHGNFHIKQVLLQTKAGRRKKR